MEITTVARAGLAPSPSGNEHARAAQGRPFKEVLAELGESKSKHPASVTDLHQQLVSLQRVVLSGRSIAPQDLLMYQITASQLNLRVEMASKLGESLLSTLRRFQNQQ